MAGLGVYRTLSRVFPRSFRAKLMAVVAGCTLPPLGVFLAWVLLHEAPTQQQLVIGVSLTVVASLLGVLAALFLLYHLLTPLRMMAEVVRAYWQEQRLPELPEDGRDEVGVLMRGINCGLREIDNGIRELERHALEDPLTHSLSRRGSDRALHACVERAERGLPLALYVLDVDNLKPVNDEYGHVAGDRMLIDLVASARHFLRESDWIGRWGGDEFLLCVHDAQESANERMRQWLRELAAPRPDGIPISVSIGCAQYRPGVDAAQLYREADAAMYAAKAQGGAMLVCDDGLRAVAPAMRVAGA
ncbi:GGDEF domain-containing protein [Lysobacter solisilvae (ex Woo and Kim 2020)]|uniref:diguanylate cyclase n=1 Tax=Agrilutibacter terrestris TaxID=2865112 RepID=A0A7H0FUG6_9GAMM|nr:GGDEF domain-containing protein [Lysobacter terrestris]QNP39682.1 GGDEF domain-containing protein [Lysobacter terrestris]